MVGRLGLFLDVGIVSPLFTCSSWGRYQELGLKIDLFKPFSLSPARGLGGTCRWPGPGGGLCTQPLPHPHVPALQACHSCRPSPGSLLCTACACCLCKLSSFARQGKESLLFGNEASSLTDSPSRVPSCQPSWTCSSCLCALSAACPSPAYGALWVPPAGVPCVHTDLPLA